MHNKLVIKYLRRQERKRRLAEAAELARIRAESKKLRNRARIK